MSLLDNTPLEKKQKVNHQITEGIFSLHLCVKDLFLEYTLKHYQKTH